MKTYNREAVVAQNAASHYIRMTNVKIASGEYPTEHVTCFCGSSDSATVTSKDRYGFDYRMALCRKCGLMYANPRFTKDAYKKFYRNEYRKIYDMNGMDHECEFADGVNSGLSLKELLSGYERFPKTVFDIGCNSGSWLKAFQDAGADVLGVDYDDRAVLYGNEHGIPILSGGLDELEATGKKADLIILNHVLEHFSDLEDSLLRIRNLLNPDGMLFVGVPGLYIYDLRFLFQNAHTYQFNGETLLYVMQCCGFEEFFLNENIQSLWTLRSEKRSKSDVPSDQPAYIHNFLFDEKKRVPQVRTMTKFPVARRREQLKAAFSLRIPDFEVLFGTIPSDVPAIVIGGGPSVDNEINRIFELKEKGYKVICIERMFQWCLANGLTPDYVVVLDASDDVNLSFMTVSDQPIYVVAAQCPTDVFERLKDYKTYLFNTSQNGIDQQSYWDANGYKTTSLINAGGSVTLCAMSIAMALGMKEIHLFGFDCHITNKNYANGITGVGEIMDIIEIEVHDRIFKTTAPYMAFAQQFFQLMEMAKKLNHLKTVKVYGDSLVCAMSKENIRDQ